MTASKWYSDEMRRIDAVRSEAEKSSTELLADLASQRDEMRTATRTALVALQRIHDDPLPEGVRAQLADVIADLTDALKET